ncbi:MAG TPA: DUF6624 domain-containing protein [Planctomycetota bacterium]|nr:DUF6624 domain-containing protein [Planctomycetota bacterium]
MHRFVLLAVLATPHPMRAQQHGPTVEDLVVHAAATPPRVDFTLSWPNSWNNERNHDAAWLVLRGPDATKGPLRLADLGHDAWGDDVAASVSASEDGLGVFVAPAGPHRGDVRWRVSLALRQAPPEHVRAWSVGMVFVPGGPFELGDDDALAQRFSCFFRVGRDGNPAGPFPITSEAALDVALRAGALWYEAGRAGYGGDQRGPIPAAWPKGSRAFYVMKHELTQGFYAEFLDALPEAWQRARAPDDRPDEEAATCSIARTDGRYVASAPERPCNFVSWEDTCALYDWLALRPMTEFEFEKAARGPRRPVPGDYPWGTASTAALQRAVQPTRDLAHAGVADERLLRDGNEAELGASYYWVMDLAGSLWERVVTAGRPEGRAFAGSHGDGVLSSAGAANNADWPHSTAQGDMAPGIGFRGGADYFAPASADDPTNPFSPVAVRTFAAWGGAQRYKTYSARACRTAGTPSAAGTLTAELAAALAKELLERQARDQAMRTQDLGAMDQERRRRAFDEWEAVDHENTARMMQIVRDHGWPTYAMVGKQAADAAFLLVQHADHEPAFQQRCLPELRAAAARGEGSKSGVAYLTDRVRVKQGRPQLYGTQYQAVTDDHGSVLADADGKLQYLPPIVEDVEGLDARRASMDLDAWAGYDRRMAQLQRRAPFERPRAWNGRLPVAADKP